VGFTAVAMQIRWVTGHCSSWTLLTLLPSIALGPRLLRLYYYGYCCPRRRWRSCCHRGPIGEHPITWLSKLARRWVGCDRSTYFLWLMKCGNERASRRDRGLLGGGGGGKKKKHWQYTMFVSRSGRKYKTIFANRSPLSKAL